MQHISGQSLLGHESRIVIRQEQRAITGVLQMKEDALAGLAIGRLVIQHDGNATARLPQRYRQVLGLEEIHRRRPLTI